MKDIQFAGSRNNKMKTLSNYFEQKQRIQNAFLKARDKAIVTERAKHYNEFWCYTEKVTNFYKKWDKKWNRIQAILNKKYLNFI